MNLTRLASYECVFMMEGIRISSHICLFVFQVVLWDKIIQRGENAVIDFKNINPKYYFWDDGKGLK